METENSIANKLRARILGVAALCAALASLGLLSPAAAGATSCQPSITACGCDADHRGIYTVANDLNGAASDRFCIRITVPHVILNLKGAHIIGSNAGVGILITREATSAIVEGGDEADNNPVQNPSEESGSGCGENSNQAVISQWDVGIDDEGDHAVIELFNAVGGAQRLGGHDPGNVTGGVLLNGVKNSIVGDMCASYNGSYGIQARHSSNVRIANVGAHTNGDSGIRLENSNFSRIGPAGASDNATTGAWLFRSSDNVVHDMPDADANNNVGIVIGCELGHKNCAGSERSDRNKIVNSGASGNKNIGVLIRKHSETNLITVNHNDGNGGQNTDMVDENHMCDSNVWYNNTGSGQPPCVRPTN